MSQQPSPTIQAVWSPYAADRDGQSGGIYMFLLRPFRMAPCYVGETGNFADRFSVHDGYFATGRRTFFREQFIPDTVDRSHRGFARRWEETRSLSPDDRKRRVFVPEDTPNLAVADEGRRYRDEWVVCLVWKIASTAKGRKSLERRVQADVKLYYSDLLGHEVDLRIPDTISVLTGAEQGDLKAAPAVSYSLSLDQEGATAAEFFKKMEAMEPLPGRK